MIPFTIPADHEVINLAAIVRVVEHPAANDAEKWAEVWFIDGNMIEYHGHAAEVITSQIMACFQVFQAQVAAVQQHNTGIIVPSMQSH